MHRDGRRATGKTPQAVAAAAELVLDGEPVVIVCPSYVEQLRVTALLSDRIEATRTLCVNQPAFTRHDALSFVWCVRHLDSAYFGSRGVSSRTTVFWDLSDEDFPVSSRTTVFWDLSDEDFPDWARDELHMAGYQRADQTAYQHNLNSWRTRNGCVPLTAETFRATARSTLEQYRSGTLR